MTDDQAKKEEAFARYTAAAHGMQSGVAFMMERGDGKETEPKHLRVGVNSTLVDHGALVQLLLDKGVISDVEFFEALATKMEADLESYERDAIELAGAIIKFR